ncbi:hypothetical protein C8R45DRAFT_206627 [Mycena sanguinolenta]|nr:hypothetical protein C8R45DRAFT_206627 [Mycena sanguinolenta]
MPKEKNKKQLFMKVRRKDETAKINQRNITLKGRPEKKILEESQRDAPVEGVVFTCDQLGAPRGFMIRRNSQTNDPIDVSQALFEENKLRKSTKDVRLTFDHSKVSITNIGSSGGIWVESKKGPLTKNSPHVLKNGDKIVFAATNEPGFEQAPDAVRIKVEILSVAGETPRSPRASFQESRDPKSLQVEYTKSTPQARLISSAPLQGRSRAQSLCDREPETCTDLDAHVRIPWSKACQLGHGLDALTGEHTATSVFKKEFKTVNTWNIRTKTDFSHLQWQNIQDLRHDFEIGIGATVNVLSHPAIGASTNITNLLSETISTSTILVQYKHEVQLTPDSFPHDLSVRVGVQQLDAAAFRARYGDYYIAGCEKMCSCRMVVECKTNEELVTEDHKKEALALVEKYFNGAIKISDLEKETSKWSLLSVVVDTEGYSDHLNFSNRILRIEDAPGTFSEILKATAGHGFPRTAILKHYSTIPSLSHLSRCLSISPLSFETARAMRNMFVHLQDRRLHPALKEFPHDRDAIDEVLENFKKLQKHIVHAGNDRKEKSVESLNRDLQSRKKRTDMLIERYGFIRTIMDTNPRIISHFPDHVNDRYLYRWQCGKTYGTEKDLDTESNATSTAPILDTSFGKCHEIFRFQWTTPETNPTILSHSPQEVTFSTSHGNRPPFPQQKPKSHSFWRRRTKADAEQLSQNEAIQLTKSKTTFYYCMPNQKPVYILGWSLSCYWPKRDPMPRIDVEHRSKHILSDRLTISVDNACPTEWHCTVFYVEQSEYNFSDLFEQRNRSESPVVRKQKWIRRVLGN